MQNLLYSSIFLFSFSGLIFAQQNSIISLNDAATGDPISGAFFEYDTTQFGVSDAAGMLTLTLYEAGAPLRVSHLSYRDTLFAVPILTIDTFRIALEPSSLTLPEISVSDKKRKFRSPKHLLKMALRAVPDNYEPSISYPLGFYRETIFHEDDPVSRAEGLFEYRLSSYTDRHNHRKAWSTAWDRRYASYPFPFNGLSRSQAFDHAEGTQLYAAVDDAYRPIQIRYSELLPPLQEHAVFRDGPLDLVALDKVRLAYDFFSRSDMRQYEYVMVDSVFIQNTYCYHIHFEPADNQPTTYHALPKTPRTGAFSGEIYIAINDLAIVAYEAQNSKPVVRNNGLQGYNIAPIGTLQIGADYAKNEADHWVLKYAYAQTTSVVDPNYKAFRSLQLVPAGGISAREEQRWYSSNYLNHLHNLSQAYDSTFWSAFEQSSIYQIAQESSPSALAASTTVFNFYHKRDDQVVFTPAASPRGNLGYVRPGQQRRNDWQWLESPNDSATTTYLRWENDYYAQYFSQRRNLLEAVAQQFSNEAQGILRTDRPTQYPDTLLLQEDTTLGFFQKTDDYEQALLLAIKDPTPGYTMVDYGWIEQANLYYTVIENRLYDQVLTVYDSDGYPHPIHFVDDFKWRTDTLYATTNNELLRTAILARWTSEDGWITQQEEPRPQYEYRLENLPNGSLILISESLTDASILTLTGESWTSENQIIPTLLAGTGPDGKGCQLDIDADFVFDCRRLENRQCAIIVKDGRQSIYARQSSDDEWHPVATPDFATVFSFDDSRSEQIVLKIEGVGSYGRLGVIDFRRSEHSGNTRQTKPELELLPEGSLTISLEGYADSIIFVTADDGTQIPCQMRWRRDKTSMLKSTLLKTYGAYGNPYLIGHHEGDIAIMNLGFAIVYVHTRGGGMRGPNWHDAGRAENKITACTDYVAALKYFKNSHPLTPTPLTGYTQSAGGPILGYAINEHPELLEAAVFDHAFLDVSGVMAESELPLTQYEYPEWGNPSNRDIRQAQAAYSPFQNIKTQTYPALLFIGGLYDKSTPYWQIAKYAAALRRANAESPGTILLRTNMRGSHPGTPFGPSLAQYFEQIAFLLEESE
ncbi:MAG: prolyl oligopeptidase family serine peptidase [Bacteroidota bacterium]